MLELTKRKSKHSCILTILIILDSMSLFFSLGKYHTQFEYFLKGPLNRRDLSNMKKLVEDSFTNVVKKVLTGMKSKNSFDDSHIYETREVKKKADESMEKELIRITISELTD